ncbi:MAG TPA: hypothetical protein PKN48_10410 [Bacteroidales bacterium]|nr:hypothetical protein [Bacteroidales bacterium]
MSFSISKKYKNTDWLNLKLTNDKSSGWDLGISIIDDRFNSRFFNYIDLIKNDEFSGFLVMSIDCLLIETLMQFYFGVQNTEIKYRHNHWKAFRDFFKNSENFNKDFKTNNICKTFYVHFRCGLLHQAQTKQKSLIKKDQPNFLTFIDQENVYSGLIIDRAQFHEKLFQEFNGYLERLKNNESNFKGENLRLNAIIKMNNICSEEITDRKSFENNK